MDWVETTGRTVDEAKRSALEQLGVDESDAEFEVVAEPRIGLFGRLKEEARVRARLQPRYPRSKGDRRDRRRTRSAGTGQGGRSLAATQGTTEQPEPSGKAAALDHLAEAPSLSASRARRRRGKAAPATAQASTKEASLDEMSTPALEEQARLVESFLQGLLERLGTSASVSTELQEEGLVDVNVTGEGLGILIGPRGTTLLALQEITRTVVQRHVASAESRVVVDINGYRKRRHEALARFAKQVAKEVVASNSKRALEPMPPSDRKVVHDAVNDIAGVTTISEGEEPNRRVVLMPLAQQPGEPEQQGGPATSEAAGREATSPEASSSEISDQKVPS